MLIVSFTIKNYSIVSLSNMKPFIYAAKLLLFFMPAVHLTFISIIITFVFIITLAYESAVFGPLCLFIYFLNFALISSVFSDSELS